VRTVAAHFKMIKAGGEKARGRTLVGIEIS
jgi:hypothetical protein